MPKSKRAQVVALTETKSRKKGGRAEILKTVREAVEQYDYVWVFSVENMRNQYLKQFRKSMGTSRFFMGKNRVMAKALGNTPEEEIAGGLHNISAALVGDVGLFFTNMGVDETRKALEQFEANVYPRAGNRAAYRVVVGAGEVVRGHTRETFPNNMEPQLRELGMPTLLKQGKIMLDSDYVICEEGDKLTPQQSHLLKHFWEKMAVFKIQLRCYWHKSDGEFVSLVDDSDPAAATASAEDDSDQDMD
ncbi:mRNA turnover and ribosome assembly protein [Coemansia javaensis]|uniref:Ribosome assembly factor mrt4 n=1 Tax=Coemansia javaensis TaxID=2761396 RepID=A0A9W8HIH7_9FUNG|nr:mRNA turnover and ribosome assembly protein [Coemansia javaensis]